jgi:hypothetical protein
VRTRIDRQIERGVGKLEATLGVRLLAPAGASEEASLLVPQTKLNAAIEGLRALGVGGAISTQSADYVFLPDDPLFNALMRRLPR